MNIQPSPAAAALAGVSRAAARGGEHDSRTSEAARQQSTSEAPAGKSADSAAVDAGDATGDRGGDGRQTYDHFEKRHNSDDEASSEKEPSAKEVQQTGPNPAPLSEPSTRLDFQA